MNKRPLARLICMTARVLPATVLLIFPSIVMGLPADCVDVDGDGYGAYGDPSCPNGPAIDCDDTNGDVYPGAHEICDGVNNNCDHPDWPSTFTWTEWEIVPPYSDALSVFAADLDGDGDQDVVSASYNDSDTIHWYRNTAGDGSEWIEHVVSASANHVDSVHAIDVDGDNDLDVVSASDGEDWIAWYENTAGDGSAWTEREISTSAEGAVWVFATDMDGDNDADVVSASQSDQIAWYENSTGSGSDWIEHVISTSADNPLSVFATDMDGDGDVDVLSASYYDHRVALYENTSGDGTA
jgi:hypothetical protein